MAAAPDSVWSLPQRRRAVVFVLTLTEGTRWAPTCRDRQLLERFAAGALSLAELEAAVASPA